MRIGIPTWRVVVDPYTQQLAIKEGRRRHSVPGPVVGLLAHLPPEGAVWPIADRAAFIKTLEVVLDYCFEKERAEMSDRVSVDDAPDDFSNEECAAWATGYEQGYRAALRGVPPTEGQT